MKKLLHDIYTLTKKDLVIERKTRELFLVMLMFALSILFILNFALDSNIKTRSEGAAGLIWVILTLAGQLGINQVIGMEKQANMFEALISAPISRTAIFLNKTCATFLSMLLMAMMIFPIYSIFYNVCFPSLHIIWIASLGCWGFATLGVLISAMTFQARTRDILLPILFYPLIIPLMIATVKITEAAFQAESMTTVSLWINQLVGFDIIFTVAGILGFDIITEG